MIACFYMHIIDISLICRTTKFSGDDITLMTHYETRNYDE